MRCATICRSNEIFGIPIASRPLADRYVSDPVALKSTALADVLTSADSSAKKYLGAGHSYLEANRWNNSHELLITLWGHFDEERVGFRIKYRVNLTGRIHRVYKREHH